MNLLRVYLTDKYALGFEVSIIVWVFLVLLIVVLFFWRRWDKQVHTVEVNINLGGIGCVKISAADGYVGAGRDLGQPQTGIPAVSGGRLGHEDPAAAADPLEWARQGTGSASSERKVVDGFRQ